MQHDQKVITNRSSSPLYIFYCPLTVPSFAHSLEHLNRSHPKWSTFREFLREHGAFLGFFWTKSWIGVIQNGSAFREFLREHGAFLGFFLDQSWIGVIQHGSTFREFLREHGAFLGFFLDQSWIGVIQNGSTFREFLREHGAFLGCNWIQHNHTVRSVLDTTHNLVHKIHFLRAQQTW